MKTKLLLFFAGCMLFLYTSCERSFVPQIDKYDELLVVDGRVTDAPGPYTIVLSKSVPLKELSKFNPYKGCKVFIEDNAGNKISTQEFSEGQYKTDSASFRGVIGRTYKLNIATPDGELYESTPEELVRTIGIQSVYAREEHKDDPRFFYGRDGYQFYINTGTPAEKDNFILWNLQCTYKFKTDFQINRYYDKGQVFLVDDEDSLRTCYRTIDILDIFTLSTKGMIQPQIKNIPLNFEDNYTKALSLRYSLKVSQFTINEAACTYWSTVKKLRDMGSDLYTTQPYQVKNNLLNITHPEKPVLGYFTVAGYSEKRIFVDHPDVKNLYDVCTLNGAPVKHLYDKLKARPDLWPYFLVDPVLYKGDFLVDQDCMDCRRKGVLKKPDFWID
jgi:hypothetical protein